MAVADPSCRRTAARNGPRLSSVRCSKTEIMEGKWIIRDLIFEEIKKKNMGGGTFFLNILVHLILAFVVKINSTQIHHSPYRTLRP